jgi:sec-independent protein translocase protein TatA
MFRTLFEGPWLIIIIVVVLLLFGAPKLPGLAKSLGQSLRIFRGEMKNMKNDAQEEGTKGPDVEAVSEQASTTKSSVEPKDSSKTKKSE